MGMLAKSICVAALIAGLTAPALAQTAPAEATRSANGKPSFDGVWTNGSSTRLERPENFKQLIVPAAEAESLRKAAIERAAAANAPTDPNAGAPADSNSQAGYNAFWTDPGIGLASIRGEARSSYVVEPADGKIPFINRTRASPNRSARASNIAPAKAPMKVRKICRFASAA